MTNSAPFRMLPRLRLRRGEAARMDKSRGEAARMDKSRGEAARLDRRRGNAAIETALMAPFLLLLMVGIADFGSATYADMEIQDAAQAGAQYALENGAGGLNATTVTNVESAVTSATTLSGVAANPTPTVYCGCASGNTITAAGCPSNTTGSAPSCAVSSSCTGSCSVACSATCGTSPSTYPSGLFISVSARGTYNTILPYPGIASSFTFTRQAVVRLK